MQHLSSYTGQCVESRSWKRWKIHGTGNSESFVYSGYTSGYTLGYTLYTIHYTLGYTLGYTFAVGASRLEAWSVKCSLPFSGWRLGVSAFLALSQAGGLEYQLLSPFPRLEAWSMKCSFLFYQAEGSEYSLLVCYQAEGLERQLSLFIVGLEAGSIFSFLFARLEAWSVNCLCL